MKRIVIFTSFFKVGQNMSGMGYRAWEFAQTLSKYYKINIVIPKPTDFEETENISFTVYESDLLGEILDNADVVFTLPEVDPIILKAAHEHNKPIISDITYNPIEALEKEALKNSTNKEDEYEKVVRQYQLHLKVSDLIIVESHEQRLFMLGALMALGRINLENYTISIDFSHLISEVPVGYNEQSLVNVLKNQGKQIHQRKLFLWNGGIWNHYDPKPIIKGLSVSVKIDPEIELMFMYFSPTKMTIDAKEAMELSKSLGLLNKNVFFNTDVITFDERDKLFLSAKAIVCSNPYAIDTMIMRRLRFRDSLLYGLPIMVTKRGSLADVVEREKIGVTFDNDDVDDIAQKMLKIANDEKYYSELSNNILETRKQFILENNIDKIVSFINEGKRSPDSSLL